MLLGHPALYSPDSWRGGHLCGLRQWPHRQPHLRRGLHRHYGLYFDSIDPTSLNKQGGDCGTRYRTGIYYTSEADLATLRKVYTEVEQAVGAPLAVELTRLENFYPAEEYHQDYLIKNPLGYCHIPAALIDYARKANK